MNIEQMRERLQKHFPDSSIEVNDLTGTQDHWEVFVESRKFEGQSRIEQHQMVMAAFQDELKSGEVHALSIRTAIRKD